MARQVRRISDLPEATELTGDELLEIVQDGDNHRVRVGDLPGGGGGGAVQSVQGRTGDVIITADDVGLGSADNTSDADKPVSAAQQTALDGKVDKLEGKGLSEEDFTTALRDKLVSLNPGSGGIDSIVAGSGITVDDSDPVNPIVSATGGGSGGGVESIVAGDGISVDDSDPANPIISATGGGGGWDTLATPAISSGALTLDLSEPTLFAVGLDQNVTDLGLVSLPSGKAPAFAVAFTQDATGGRTVAWPASVIGTPPDIGSDPGAVTVVSLAYIGGGQYVISGAIYA